LKLTGFQILSAVLIGVAAGLVADRLRRGSGELFAGMTAGVVGAFIGVFALRAAGIKDLATVTAVSAVGAAAPQILLFVLRGKS
jgi:uncharacterized membrane protein YeaQ/YmgE (transglycosylase-associated protein family)